LGAGWSYRTRHGDIETPAFVPVATRGAVRSISSKDLEEVGAQCALANTYHFYLIGGDVVVKKFGGLHKFMNFQKPLFTDSGGFQVFSFGLGREHGVSKIGGIFPKENSAEELGRARKKKLAVVTDEGVSFARSMMVRYTFLIRRFR
jgi:tRNA-guanine family transglycosylase